MHSRICVLIAFLTCVAARYYCD